MRAVLDPNVPVSAVPSPTGTPAALLRAWLRGAYELIVSPALLDELARVLGYPKIARGVSPDEARELLTLLRGQAKLVADPEQPSNVRSRDPDDDYLISLANATTAVIVSGDADLQGLADRIPVYPPAAFLALLPGK